MSDFKVGDSVRVIDPHDIHTGREGEVFSEDAGNQFPFTVIFSGGEAGIYKELEIEAVKEAPAVPEAVEHPAHYGGDTPYEVIKVAEAWGLDKDAYLFNVIKYVGRADKKGKQLEDLKKARFYLDRRIKQLADG